MTHDNLCGADGLRAPDPDASWGVDDASEPLKARIAQAESDLDRLVAEKFDLLARAERSEQERDAYRTVADGNAEYARLGNEMLDNARADLARVTAERDRLRAALEAISGQFCEIMTPDAVEMRRIARAALEGQ
jgi:hypothetical protein